MIRKVDVNIIQHASTANTVSQFYLIPFLVPQYCLLAALLFYLLPGDVTYVAVAGLFLTMKVIGGMLIVVVVVVTDC